MTHPLAAYKVIGNGTSFRIVNGQQTFNRGIKRGETSIISGDKPRFAMIRTLNDQEQEMNPDMIKLGEGRIRLRDGHSAEWLDDNKNIETCFHASKTVYRAPSRLFPGLLLELCVSQADEWGIIANISLTNQSKQPLKPSIDLIYGKLARLERSDVSSYFPEGSPDPQNNLVIVSDSHAVLTGDRLVMNDQVIVRSIPDQVPVIAGVNVMFTHILELEPNETKTIYLIAGHSYARTDIHDLVIGADPVHLIEEAEKYYTECLSQYRISTPNPAIDSGFLTAILNLDYDYSEPAWLEGVHKWSSFWVNNYQISAAVSLGQEERAKKALAFFASREGGLCPIICATGKPYTIFHTPEFYYDDGVPYFIYQLLQYYEHTGDRELIISVWDRIREALARIWRNRDENNNYLLWLSS